MNFIKLTLANGDKPIYINPKFIKRIYQTNYNGSDIEMVGDDEENYHYVNESPEQVIEIIKQTILDKLKDKIENNAYLKMTIEERNTVRKTLEEIVKELM